MPVKPDSRFAALPVLGTRAPDGSERHVVALRLQGQVRAPGLRTYVITGNEPIDLIARRTLGSEGLWWRILDAQPLVYPLDLSAGEVLELPDPALATRVTRARSF